MRRFVSFWPLLPIVVIGAAWQWLNADDELPTPELTALRAQSPRTEPFEGNGFVWMIGASAPSNTNWREYVRDRLAKQIQAIPDVGPEAQASDMRTQPRSLPPNLACRPEHRRCASITAGDAIALRTALAELNDLEHHFVQMRSQPVFEETSSPVSIQSPMPDFGGIVRAQDFAIAGIRLATADRRWEDVVSLLEEDNAFARRALAGSRHVIGRRVSVSLLARNALLGVRLWIEFGGELAPYRERLMTLMAPFPDSSAQLVDAFDLELRTLVHDLSYSGRQSLAVLGRNERSDYSAAYAPIFNAFIGEFYRPVATANHLVALASTQRVAYQVSSNKFDEARLRAETARLTFRKQWRDYVINPFGSELAALGVPDFLDRQSTVHNVQTLLVLARAHLMISPNPTVEEWKPVLASLRDPYTHFPLTLDVELKQPKIRARGSDSLFGQMTLMTGGYIVADPPPLPLVETRGASQQAR